MVVSRKKWHKRKTPAANSDILCSWTVYVLSCMIP